MSVTTPAFQIPRWSVVGMEGMFVKMWDPPTVSPATPDEIAPTNPVPEIMAAAGFALPPTAPHTMQLELLHNLSAAAHLIHGSSEGRFRITYCPGPGMSQEAIRSVGFEPGDLKAALKRYNPDQLKDGPNRLPDGEEVFYISNPALGLWALKSQFEGRAV